VAVAVFLVGVLEWGLTIPPALGSWAWPYLVAGPLLLLAVVAWGLLLSTRASSAAADTAVNTSTMVQAPEVSALSDPTAAVDQNAPTRH
jgi:hypothetical protein